MPLEASHPPLTIWVGAPDDCSGVCVCVVVCLEDLSESGEGVGGRCRTLPCDHTFHLDCIRAWGEQCNTKGWTQTCPLCREEQR